MPIRPVSPARLVGMLADRLAAAPRDRWLRVIVDGPPPTEPGRWAAALVEPLRVAGRPAVHVSAGDFLRPASLRYERGRTDPDSRYDNWLDTGGLIREVLAPLEPGGTGRVLPALWNPDTDRSARADYVTVPPGGVVLLSGDLLLGRGLPAELTVHFDMTPAALARRTPPDLRWTLPAYARYAAEVDPRGCADVVVRLDDPRRPAVVTPAGAAPSE